MQKFDYQISEGNARFVENIETNLGKNIVKIHTPAHNDILESYLMQDFQKVCTETMSVILSKINMKTRKLKNLKKKPFKLVGFN